MTTSRWDCPTTGNHDGIDVDVIFTGKPATLGARVLRRQVAANVDTYFDPLVEHAGDDR